MAQRVSAQHPQESFVFAAHLVIERASIPLLVDFVEELDVFTHSPEDDSSHLLLIGAEAGAGS